MLQSRRQILGQLAGAAAAAPALARPLQARLEPTPNEIVGPFYPLAKPADTDADLTMVAGRTGRAIGQVIEISGQIMDLRGRPVPGTRLEIWQANAAGRYAHPSDDNPAPLDPNFQGYASLSTDADGRYRIITVKPAGYPGGRRGMRAPHIHFDLAGRTDRLVVQMYFPDEPLNATDALLRANIRPAMVIAATTGADASGILRYRWDMVLRTG
ncbi:protocatechuate 3,4-dioxygenase subunit beta [Sphingomonas sp. BT-65]|uniref:dioxygenase family protein n=1 Tax=Sphingomonas sp. BT-65 TaxID=2989821 RepID=UPI002235506A|nr:protocatechuate 3,4-dioxygenase subunit beta [Sphingomonas sp. BT-65]MCW4460131.1 protocatechuate 3,4-dioxygenase subunit beta [Sphingomonas sp. BT-65]